MTLTPICSKNEMHCPVRPKMAFISTVFALSAAAAENIAIGLSECYGQYSDCGLVVYRRFCTEQAVCRPGEAVGRHR